MVRKAGTGRSIGHWGMQAESYSHVMLGCPRTEVNERFGWAFLTKEWRGRRRVMTSSQNLLSR